MDFLARMDQRKSARDAERSRLNKRLLEINREAEEDEIATRVYRKVGAEPSAAEKPIQALSALPTNSAEVRPAQPKGMKVKEAILAVLKDARGGLTAKQIRGRAFLKCNAELNPNTLTVTLIRMKEDKIVRIEGRQWFYIRPNQGAYVIATRARTSDSPERIEATAPVRANGLSTVVGVSRLTQTSMPAEKG